MKTSLTNHGTIGLGRLRMATLLLAATGLTLLATPAAWAHAHLSEASPAADSRIATAPAQVVLRFTQALEIAFSSIQVSNARGQPVPGARVEQGRDAQELKLALPSPLPPGRYTVDWKATSVDTHSTSGRYVFEVAP